MLVLSEALPIASSCRVEVSGWDEDEIFFVEKSELSWDDFAGKHISLKHMLAEGALVFIRTLQPASLQRSFPIAYEAEFIGCDVDGSHEFRLNPAQPRHSRNRFPVN
ncbi:MAG: hypothetical protein WCE53_08590 [Candidatus Acidiferrum sp.]